MGAALLKFIFLFPLTCVYALAAALHRIFTRQVDLGRPVISVGNMTWGGTGKTPLVIKTAKYCIENGLKPAILIRGYNRKNNAKPSVVVSDGKSILASVEESGDEPLAIAESVKEAVVMVGTDRVRSAKIALEKYAPDVFILDDGFQHWRIKRDLDIVCINALNPFGNGFLIPYGILREPVSSLRRAGMIVLNHSDCADTAKLDRIKKVAGRYFGKEIVETKYTVKNIRSIKDGVKYSVEEFPYKKVNMISGLGNNAGFLKTLESCGLEVENKFYFQDHHWYSEKELHKVIYKMSDDSCVVTTTKDEYKIKNIIADMELDATKSFFVVEIDADFVNGSGLWEKEIKKALRFS